jgi:ParB family chromosome partitioning protein
MNAKRRGLGRGLDALLGGLKEHQIGGDAQPTDALGYASAATGAVTHLPVDLIRRGRYQPRRDFDPDGLRELADSIAAQGVIQPIVVRPVGEGRYEIIAGERRWRAAQQAGLTQNPVVVREVEEQSAVAIGLIENIQRADLNPMEEAAALNRLLHEFGLTHQQVAEAVGKSRTTVTNLLRLLELTDEVKAFVESRNLEMGHARCLLGLKGPRQTEAARAVVARDLSVRETEKLVRRLQAEERGELHRNPKPEMDPDIRRLLTDLTDRLGARVEIQQGTKGAGKLLIAYNSLDELDGILAHIK